MEKILLDSAELWTHLNEYAVGMDQQIAIHWFRRDLRLEDNTALWHALKSDLPVLPLFIFDTNILDKLKDRDDRRVSFLHAEVHRIKSRLEEQGSTLLIEYGEPLEIWKKLLSEYPIKAVYLNTDYEPYARRRDKEVEAALEENDIAFHAYKDHVIFEKDEVLKSDGTPYQVFTPYSRLWRECYEQSAPQIVKSEEEMDGFLRLSPKEDRSLESMGFEKSAYPDPPRSPEEELIKKYKEKRNFPAQEGTSRLGVHLRFGTISIRKLVDKTAQWSKTFINELIWRDFYQMILWHFPHTEEKAFRPAYDHIPWRNDEDEFEKWTQGKTGYELVDAGMRQLVDSGYMHNRVRMLVASFLTKHLLIDWKWGERFFARYLMDYDLASNVGGWQWAAGSGTDAAPYFRIFNPHTQLKKFDKNLEYSRRWIPEVDSLEYQQYEIVEHKFARERALKTYKTALEEYKQENK